MKTHTTLGAAILAAALASAVPARSQPVDRLPDPDVRKLIEDVDTDRDRYENALDDKVKDTMLRGPGGEVNLKRFLDDFQDNTKKFKDRFKGDYAASTEAQTVLRQATAIDRFMAGHDAALKGRSEWDRMLADLRRLAGVYGTTFPTPEQATVRRISDQEAAKAADALAKQAETFKDAVGNEKTLPPAQKDQLKAGAEHLHNQARELKSRLEDSKPATAEARQTIEAAAAVAKAMPSAGLSPASLTAWGAGRAPLETIEQAFDLARRP